MNIVPIATAQNGQEFGQPRLPGAPPNFSRAFGRTAIIASSGRSATRVRRPAPRSSRGRRSTAVSASEMPCECRRPAASIQAMSLSAVPAFTTKRNHSSLHEVDDQVVDDAAGFAAACRSTAPCRAWSAWPHCWPADSAGSRARLHPRCPPRTCATRRTCRQSLRTMWCSSICEP